MTIKVEAKIDEEKGLVMLAFEASQEKDYEVLDMIFHILDQKVESKLGYLRSNRLVGHFKGVIAPKPPGSESQ